MNLPPRLHYLDNIRSTNMLAVIMLHATLAYAVQNYYPWPLRDIHAIKGFSYLIVFLHEFTMPLFFLIAGYFARQLYLQLGLKKFIRQRTIRIGIPLLLGILALFSVNTLTILNTAAVATDVLSKVIAHKITIMQFIKQTLINQYSFSTYNNLSYFWFLYYLVILYLLTITAILLQPTLLHKYALLFLNKLLNKQSKFSPFMLALPAALLLLLSANCFVATPTTFIPQLSILFFYAYFYWIGWQLPAIPPIMNLLSKQAELYLLLQFAIFLPSYIFLTHYGTSAKAFNYYLLKFTACYCYTIGTWLMIFFIFALFIKYFNKCSKIMRYLADASYWGYLIQIPIIINLQFYLLSEPWPTLTKILLTATITILIIIVSYCILVRYTFIGQILNGSRTSKVITNQDITKH